MAVLLVAVAASLPLVCANSPMPGETDPPTTTAIPTSAIPTTSIPTTDQERLADCERRAADATVRFVPDVEMEVDKVHRFTVTASLAGTSPPTSTGPSTTVVPVALRCEVQAELRGARFDVEPEGFRQASFLDRPTINWAWDVTPTGAGDHTLTLEIRSVAVVDGRRIEGAGGELYTSTIHVAAVQEGLWDRSKRWSGELVDHPLVKGLSSLVALAGVLAAAWRWLLKRPWPWKKQPPPDDPPEEKYRL